MGVAREYIAPENAAIENVARAKKRRRESARATRTANYCLAGVERSRPSWIGQAAIFPAESRSATGSRLRLRRSPQDRKPIGR